MPQGGSVSLEMLPILFIAVRRGLVPALDRGRRVRLLQLLLPGAFLVQPVQVLLDYPLAFGALGLAGLVPVPARRAPCLGRGPAGPGGWCRSSPPSTGAVALGVSARFVCHFLSGIIFFGQLRPAGRRSGCTR